MIKLSILLFLSLGFLYPANTLSQGTELLTADQIIKLIPDKIQGYRPSTDPLGKIIKLGTLRYAMAERGFHAKRTQSIKVLLFDYKEAPIMYNQATRKFSTFQSVETDSLILRPVYIKDCTGWETYNVHKNSAQILLGICDRYFLTIEGNNVDLVTLKNFVSTFKIDTYPK